MEHGKREGSGARPSFSSLFLQERVRIFCSLAETRSFSETARQTGISQPTVSRQILELEDDLGFALFDRTTRPIRLSPEGRMLLGVLARQREDLGKTLDLLRTDNAIRRPLKLGIVESVASGMSGRIARGMKDLYSTLTILTGISTYLMQLLDEEKIDFLICPEPFLNRNDLTRSFIFREPSVLAFPPGFDLGPLEPLSWEGLQTCGLPLVHYHEMNSGGKLEQKYFNALGLEFPARFTADINAILLGFVKEGLGWALVRPTTLAQHDDLARTIQAAPAPEPLLCREVYAVTRKGEDPAWTNRLTSLAAESFRLDIVPKFIRKVPWVLESLRVSGEGDPSGVPFQS
ncbi:MAG: LysR family transcriptional regulator [Sutterellaceae bacterium]|nr:LysR family transcriptional regulator [Sutterellaceae bacterium]MDD7441617.1 LysR family transcriptional regulator [Sutterellaceae bacterium]MDY2868968.1 LysR family transcriptional regulator [Mesosutterella sp.]